MPGRAFPYRLHNQEKAWQRERLGLTVPVSVRSGGSPGNWKYSESIQEFPYFQNGNRIICADKEMKEYYKDSKGYLEIVQLDPTRVQADPDYFGVMLGGSGVETHFPEGICRKIE